MIFSNYLSKRRTRLFDHVYGQVIGGLIASGQFKGQEDSEQLFQRAKEITTKAVNAQLSNSNSIFNIPGQIRKTKNNPGLSKFFRA